MPKIDIVHDAKTERPPRDASEPGQRAGGPVAYYNHMDTGLTSTAGQVDPKVAEEKPATKGDDEK